MPDADLDQVVAALQTSAFGCAGERCMAGSVALPVGGISDDSSTPSRTIARFQLAHTVSRKSAYACSARSRPQSAFTLDVQVSGWAHPFASSFALRRLNLI